MAIQLAKLGYQATRLFLGETLADIIWQADCVMKDECIPQSAMRLKELLRLPSRGSPMGPLDPKLLEEVRMILENR